MIALLSKRDHDLSTEDVIDWLTFYKSSFVRINGNDFISNLSFNSESFTVDTISKIEDINICWFRRWMEEDSFGGMFADKHLPKQVDSKLSTHLKSETAPLSAWLFDSLSEKKWLSHPKEFQHSKLKMLHEANKVGIRIPDTIITTRKAAVKDFLTKNNRIISKSIRDIPYIYFDDCWVNIKTLEVTSDLIEELPEAFFPSLFQELIEKEYELRVFYLDGTFYPMVIFSQLDTQTQLDFRHYNIHKPNRTGPYKLPAEIEEKLLNLMKALGMTTGSLDLIRSKTGEYVFLEINPVGQFGMTSEPCNYFLHREVAKFLHNNNTPND